MQTWIGAVILLVGLVLLGYMVVAEGEPGALPLALVAIGAVWLGGGAQAGRRQGVE
jgi:hypothetical protein